MEHACSIEVQQCSNAVMQRCSDAAMLASLVSHRPVLVRWLFVEKRARELLDSWSGRFSCGVHSFAAPAGSRRHGEPAWANSIA
jgi:hypothetical protein